MTLIFHRQNDIYSDLFNNSKTVVSENGLVVVDEEWNGTFDNSPFSRIYCILDGSGRYKINDGEYKEFIPGNIYFLPFRNRLYFEGGKMLKKLYFHINILGRNGFDIFDGMHNDVVIPSTVEKLNELANDYCGDNYASYFRLRDSLSGVILKAVSESPAANAKITDYSKYVVNAMDYIRENLSSAMTISDIAKTLFVSESFLKKTFSSEVGISIGKYIDQLIMFKAEQLLLNREMSVEAVSEKLGFCDQFYFSRKFKQLVGTTPSLYRKRNISAYVWVETQQRYCTY